MRPIEGDPDADQQGQIHKKLKAVRRFIILGAFSTILILLSLLIFLPVDEHVKATGVVRSQNQNFLYAPYAGIFGKCLVEEGTTVDKGQAIIEMDATEFQEKRQQTQAKIEQAKTALQHQQTSLERLSRNPLPKEFWHLHEEMAMATKKLTQSETEVERNRLLYEKEMVSKLDFERTQLNHDLLKEEVTKIQQKLQVLESGLESAILSEARAEIQSAYAALASLEVENTIYLAAMERGVLRAPEKGRVTMISKSRPGQPIAKGEDLVHLSQGEATHVEILVGESQYHRIKAGQHVLMQSNAFDSFRYGYIEGTIEGVSLEPLSDSQINTPTSPPKYLIAAKVESTPQPLVIGSTVEVKIILQRAPLWKLLIPEAIR